MEHENDLPQLLDLNAVLLSLRGPVVVRVANSLDCVLDLGLELLTHVVLVLDHDAGRQVFIEEEVEVDLIATFLERAAIWLSDRLLLEPSDIQITLISLRMCFWQLLNRTIEAQVRNTGTSAVQGLAALHRFC